MWSGYIGLGGLEVGNSARALGYARTANCPVSWLRDVECGGIRFALDDDVEYVHPNISDAPWFDPDDPDTTGRFFGVYLVSVEGLSDSTRTASVTERVTAGGRIGRVRAASRQFRVRAALTADGTDALEAGMSWLNAVLDANACGSHGTMCGTSDFEFFAACPPAPGPDGPDDPDYIAEVDSLRRVLHGVGTISGPLVQQELHSSNRRHVGYIVEFTLVAEEPFVYSVTREVPVVPSLPFTVHDIPQNMAKYPSAELAGGSVLVSQNLSPNPSVESNATGWSLSSTGEGGIFTPPGASYIGSRSSDIAAVGSWSYRLRLLGDSGATPQTDRLFGMQIRTPTVDLSPFPYTRPSASVWAMALISGGADGSEIVSMTVAVVFENGVDFPADGGSITTTDPADFAGRVYSFPNQEPPAGYDQMTVWVSATVRYSSSATPANNSDIRLYADAHAITIP